MHNKDKNERERLWTHKKIRRHEEGYEHITKDKNAWERLRMHEKG